MFFIFLKIINDSLSPTLEDTKRTLQSDIFRKLILSTVEDTIETFAILETPVKTGDLLESITDEITREMGVYSNFSIVFGARGGSDPVFHSDPENYALKVGGEGEYFNTIFKEVETMFISSFERNVANLFNEGR